MWLTVTYRLWVPQELDLSGTGVEGFVPSSWQNLVDLQQLDLHNTGVFCQLQLTADGVVQCYLPSLLETKQTLQQLPSTSSSSQFIPGVHCQTLGLATGGLTTALIDPTFSSLTLCQWSV
jgi:hypothetical protein